MVTPREPSAELDGVVSSNNALSVSSLALSCSSLDTADDVMAQRPETNNRDIVTEILCASNFDGISHR